MKCIDAHGCDTEALPGSSHCARHTGSLAARDAAVVLKLRAEKRKLIDVTADVLTQINKSSKNLVGALREAIK
jgi:hypothetical protein